MSEGIISRFVGQEQSTSQKVTGSPVRAQYAGGRSARGGSDGRKPKADAASRRPSRYTYKSVHADSVQTLEPKKDLRVYTDEERRSYKHRQQEIARQKSAVAKRWIGGYIADIKRSSPDRRVSMPSLVYCGNPLWRKDRPEAPRTASVIYDGKTDQVYYEHQNCHNIWCCPVCSQKDMYKRSMMLSAGMQRAAGMGLRMLFLTFTIPHEARETTREVLSNLVAAYRDFGHQRSVIGLKKRFGYVGAVKATDFTYNPVDLDGRRLWNAHAHYHCVWFFDTETDLKTLATAVKSVFLEEWARCQEKLTGRSLNREHGFNVEIIDIPEGDDEQAAKVAEYAAKTVSLYVGKASSGKGSMMPLDFLTPPSGREEEYRSVFLDYYAGTKGVRRMVWTPGLKGLLLDEFDAETPYERSVKIGEMSSLLVYLLNRDDDAREQVEEAFANHDLERAETVARLAVEAFEPTTATDGYYADYAATDASLVVQGFYRLAFSRYVGDALANRCRAEKFREYLRRSLKEHVEEFEDAQTSKEIERIHTFAIEESYRRGGTFGVEVGGFPWRR